MLVECRRKIAAVVGEAQQPETGAIALLRVWPALENLLDEGFGRGADRRAPAQ